MDPEARQETWSLLKEHKAGKVIILTTHFMDEADDLGDRIGIMAHGKLKVAGSSLFLKDKFGLGYTLTITSKDPEMNNSISKEVLSMIPEAKLLSTAGSEISFQVPHSQNSCFAKLLSSLESMKREGGYVEDYGLSSTTLEEVFMKVAEEDHDQDQDQENELNRDQDDIDETEDIRAFCEVQVEQVTATAQLHALFQKRLMYARREWSEIARAYIMPVLYVAFAFVLYNTLSFVPVVKPQVISLPAYGFSSSAPLTLLTQGNASEIPLCRDQDRDRGLRQAGVDCVSIDPLVTPGPFSCGYGSGGVGYGIGFSGGTLPVSTVIGQCHQQDSFSSQSYLLANALAGHRHKGTAYLSAMSIPGYRPLWFYNSSTTNMPVAISNALSENKFKIKIKITNHPFPLLDSVEEIYTGVRAIILTMLIAIAFGQAASKTVAYPVKERISGVKHQIFACGVSPSVYWGHLLLFDLCLYWALVLVFIFLVLWFQVTALTSHPQAFLSVVGILMMGGNYANLFMTHS